ncbi:MULTISPECIES: zeta toxin family protein [Arthrobacter]|nr:MULTISPECIES: zeta toxin family protein [Arthrobacter]
MATYVLGRPLPIEQLRAQRLLLDELLAEGDGDIEKGGLAAIITAGPPGAGKTTARKALGMGGLGWRVIDADEIKVRLLEAAVQDGRFDSVFTRTLADGYPVMPNEISTLVHNESVDLANRLIERSLEAQENVVIEGTLSWEGLPQRYLKWLELNDYNTVTVFDVEVDRETALEQAYKRWAEGRIGTINGTHIRGGRFTPKEAITSLYDETGRHSKCNQNAVDFFNSPAAAGFGTLELLVTTPDTEEPRTYQRLVGKHSGTPPVYLQDAEVLPEN